MAKWETTKWTVTNQPDGRIDEFGLDAFMMAAEISCRMKIHMYTNTNLCLLAKGRENL